MYFIFKEKDHLIIEKNAVLLKNDPPKLKVYPSGMAMFCEFQKNLYPELTAPTSSSRSSGWLIRFCYVGLRVVPLKLARTPL